jgi:hypothetical protein
MDNSFAPGRCGKAGRRERVDKTLPRISWLPLCMAGIVKEDQNKPAIRLFW